MARHDIASSVLYEGGEDRVVIVCSCGARFAGAAVSEASWLYHEHARYQNPLRADPADLIINTPGLPIPFPEYLPGHPHVIPGEEGEL